ncbi:uncharacterized protein LOC121739881 [Aricia agestis]|uniref:uncharacterized protein LOC121739881 n=1 Tax=Aricia agestis TaxID=91739 RepID=UPI001C208E04|nr:uncharacterized protein LOC121739881 [Aricia agestis]
MPNQIDKDKYDLPTLFLAFLAFCLPLALLIPGFSIWDIVPKTHVTRYFVFRQDVSWSQLNAIAIAVLLTLFCLYLEIKRRKLDEMVEDVLRVSEQADKVMEIEKERQVAAIKDTINLLDVSSAQYENLMLLSDDLRKRALQRPPAIDSSSS